MLQWWIWLGSEPQLRWVHASPEGAWVLDLDMNVSCSFHGSQMEAVRTEVGSGFELSLHLWVLELTVLGFSGLRSACLSFGSLV